MKAPPLLDTPSIAGERRLNAVCDAFESAWKAALRGQARPAISDFLDKDAEPELVRELITLDVHYGRQHGEQPSAEDYLAYATNVDPSLFAESMFGSGTHGADAGQTQDQLPISTPMYSLPRQFGEYELLEEIARGGMGVVFKARQHKLQRVIALKMILAGQLASASQVERFHAEAEAAAKLEHPHIVPIYEVGEHAGQHYFTMRLIEGANLGQLLSRMTAAPRTAARLMLQVADAVQHAHSKAILHRDLKPANILLEGDPTGPLEALVPYVTDFGLAKHLESGDGQTKSEALIGTPAYMAPEQAASQRRQIGTATDVYGLGAILYALLTGRPPFADPSLAKLLVSVQHDEPASIRSFNGAIPADLETICLKALHKEPAKRYASAADFAADLSRFLNHEPIHARPVGRWERARKWVRRQPMVAALTALLILVASTGLSVIIWKWREAEAQSERADTKAKAEIEANIQAQAALRKVRLSEYFQSVAHADLEYMANNVVAAEQILDHCDPELRGWEWRYVKAQCQAPLWSFKGSAGIVTAVAFSPTGRHLAIGSGRVIEHDLRLAAKEETPGIDIIELGTGRLVRRLDGLKEQVRDMKFSPDGRTLYSCGGHWERPGSGELFAWETGTWKRTWNLTGKFGTMWRLAIAPNGKSLALASARTVQLWDTARQRRLHSIASAETVHDVAFRADGRRVAAALHDSVRVYDTTTGKQVAEFTKLPGVDMRAIAWHPKEELLAVGSFSGKSFLLNLDTGAIDVLDQRNDVYGQITGAAFALQGGRVAFSGSDGTVHLWQTATRKLITVLRGHTRAVHDLDFSPAGHLLATGSWDGTVKVWDTLAMKSTNVAKGPPGRIQAIACTADGRHVVTAGYLPETRSAEGPLTLWDTVHAKRLEVLGERKGGFTSVALSRDDLLAHDWDRQIKLLRRDRNTWKEWLTLPGHDERIAALAFHPGGAELASAGRDRSVKIWRWRMVDKTPSADLHANLAGHDGVVNAVAYFPQGDRIVTGDAAGTVRVWCTKTHERLAAWSAHNCALIALAMNPKGTEMATGGADGTIAIWDLPGATRRHVLHAHAGQVTGLAYAPDGARLAASGDDGDVSLWDTVSAHRALTLRKAIIGPHCVVFSSDGERLVAGSGNGSLIKIWDARDPIGERDKRLHDWHKAELIEAEKKNRHPAIVFHLTGRLTNKPDDADMLVRRAWSFAELGRWDEAARDSARAVQLGAKTDTLAGSGFKHCWLRTAFGSKDENRSMAERILAKYENADDPFTCYLVGIVCGFREDAIVNPERLVALMKRATSTAPKKSYHWEVRAVAHLRAGQWKEAIIAAEKVRAIEPRGRGVESFVEAMAYLRLGNREQALKCYEQGQAHLANHGDYERRSQTRYFDYLSFQREAAQGLNLPLPPLVPMSAKIPAEP
jgi:WD40 repeat protein/tRNA A-37 threonylcarbamoyl transferase component Bud32